MPGSKRRLSETTPDFLVLPWTLWIVQAKASLMGNCLRTTPFCFRLPSVNVHKIVRYHIVIPSSSFVINLESKHSDTCRSMLFRDDQPGNSSKLTFHPSRFWVRITWAPSATCNMSGKSIRSPLNGWACRDILPVRESFLSSSASMVEMSHPSLVNIAELWVSTCL